MKNDIIITEKLQVLNDKKNSGKNRPWREKKEAATYLAYAYREVDEKKSVRVENCASFLQFKRLESGELRLHSADFCRVRLCPVCAWRRSLKIYSNMTKIMGEIAKNGYEYLFITFTVKNVHGHELSKSLTDMFGGWQRMTQTKAFRKVSKGWYRGLEVTHNLEFDTYHPHFHAVLAVEPSYFKKYYISQANWVEMWRKAMRLDYSPVVDVRRVKGDTARAVAESAKYAVKDKDYIIPEDWDLTVESVRILDFALANRRLVGYGGAMRDAHRLLNLQDEQEGDLIHIDGEKPEEESANLVTYVWNTGYWQYYQKD